MNVEKTNQRTHNDITLYTACVYKLTFSFNSDCSMETYIELTEDIDSVLNHIVSIRLWLLFCDSPDYIYMTDYGFVDPRNNFDKTKTEYKNDLVKYLMKKSVNLDQNLKKLLIATDGDENA